MHALEVEVSNFMRIDTVHIVDPGDDVVEIVGKNGNGKTSLLTAIEAALGGGLVIPEQPIRKGEKEAFVRIKLGVDKPTLIVKRTFTAKEEGGYKTEIFVEAPDGARYVKPQAQLDALYGALAFDPIAFTRLKPAEQLEQLRSFVPGFDFKSIDEANKGDFERRTETTRQLKAAKARLDAVRIPGDPRQERIDESALVAELEQAGQTAAAIEKERARRLDLMRDVRSTASEGEQCARRGQESLDRIAVLQNEIVRLEAHAKRCAQEATDAAASAAKQQAAVEALPPLDPPPDTASIKARIDTARKNNLCVDERERVTKDRERIAGEVDELEKRVATYTERIDARKKQKHDAVAAAQLPIEGLGFADDGVLYNGIPFQQASMAEKIRVSVAITAALASKLKIALVRDASVLDDDNMALLRALAKRYGFQLWVERVGSDSAVGIVIEDGRVVGPAPIDRSEKLVERPQSLPSPEAAT